MPTLFRLSRLDNNLTVALVKISGCILIVMSVVVSLYTPSAFGLPSVRPLEEDSIFQVGEELTYNVSYASFDIGQVRIKLVDAVVDQGKVLYKATATIDSYKG